jgi:hypothetical protein
MELYTDTHEVPKILNIHRWWSREIVRQREREREGERGKLRTCDDQEGEETGREMKGTRENTI